MEKHDPALPTWSKLKDVVDNKPDMIATPSSSITELREDGTVPIIELNKKGFEISKHVIHTGGEGPVFTIIEFCEDGKHVTLQADDAEEYIKVERINLLAKYKVHTITQPILLRQEDNAPAHTFKDMTISIWKGLAKAALASQFKVSSESNVLIQSWPNVHAIAGANFAAGKLNIVAITNNVEVVKKSSPHTPYDGMQLAEISDTLILVAKPHLTLPKETKDSDRTRAIADVFHASYWAVGKTIDSRIANVVPSSKVVSAKLFGNTYDITVHFYTNERAIDKGEKLVLLTKHEPEPKRARIEEDQTKSKGVKGGASKSVKGKAKGKGKNKKAK